MLDAPTIVGKIVTRIGLVYDRPLMFGGTAAGAELVIECLHSIWALCLEREEQYRTVMAELHQQELHHAMSCSTWYAHEHTSANEVEIAAYVVSFYKRLDALLGLQTISVAVENPILPDVLDMR